MRSTSTASTSEREAKEPKEIRFEGYTRPLYFHRVVTGDGNAPYEVPYTFCGTRPLSDSRAANIIIPGRGEALAPWLPFADSLARRTDVPSVLLNLPNQGEAPTRLLGREGRIAPLVPDPPHKKLFSDETHLASWQKGHIDDLSTYGKTVATFVRDVLPESVSRITLVGFSAGTFAIKSTLRECLKDPSISGRLAGAVLMSPITMFNIGDAPPMVYRIASLGTLLWTEVARIPFGTKYVPGTGPIELHEESFPKMVESLSSGRSAVSTDPDDTKRLLLHYLNNPTEITGGPTVDWLGEIAREAHRPWPVPPTNEPRFPILVIEAEEDRRVRPGGKKYWSRLLERSGAEVLHTLIPGAGHHTLFSGAEPRAHVEEQIIQFIERQSHQDARTSAGPLDSLSLPARGSVT